MSSYFRAHILFLFISLCNVPSSIKSTVSQLYIFTLFILSMNIEFQLCVRHCAKFCRDIKRCSSYHEEICNVLKGIRLKCKMR